MSFIVEVTRRKADDPELFFKLAACGTDGLRDVP